MKSKRAGTALFVILLLMVQLSAATLIYSKHSARKLFAQLQELESKQDQLLTEFGMLQLEQSTWATHGRIESIASEKLSMHVPGYENVVVIQK